MPSVRSTTASKSPRATHRSSENQYGPIRVQALESVRRRSIPAGPSEGLGRGAPGPDPRSSSSRSRFLPPSRNRRLQLLRLRPAAVALEARALRQRAPTTAGIRLKPLVAMIHSGISRSDLTGLAGNTREGTGEPGGGEISDASTATRAARTDSAGSPARMGLGVASDELRVGGRRVRESFADAGDAGGGHQEPRPRACPPR